MYQSSEVACNANSPHRLKRSPVERLCVTAVAEGGVERTELDVGEGDGGIGALLLDISGDTRVRGARAAIVAGSGAVSWVGGVEPKHVGVVVIPDGHDENHTLFHTSGHRGESAMVLKGQLITEGFLLGVAEVLVDGVARDTLDLGLRVGDNSAVLDVEALDLAEGTGLITSVGDELGDNSEDGAGVNGPTITIEFLVTHAVGVEVAPIRVARAGVTLIRVSTTAASVSAHNLAGVIAGVRSVGSCHGVGFPDIHLRAASAVASNTSVGVVIRWFPALNIAL